MNNPIRRLRNKSIFHNGIIPLLVSMLISLFVPIFLDSYVRQNYNKTLEPEYFFLSMAVSTAVLFGLYSLIRKIPSSQDRQKMKDSEFPEWLPVTDEIAAAAAYDSFTVDFIVYAVIAGIFFISLITSSPPMSLVIGSAVFIAVLTAFLYSLMKHEEKFWSEVDDTAIYAKIPVDRTFRVKHRSGHDDYAVFYLPDGKYVVKVRSCAQKSVFILCYKNRIKVLGIVEAPNGDLINDINDVKQLERNLRNCSEYSIDKNREFHDKDGEV